MLDGQTIPNPLRSFVLPVAIVDQVQGDPVVYSKPQGYETVRYPLSGLVGTPQDQAATQAHNANYPNYAQTVGILDNNITNWLNGQVVIDGNAVGRDVSATSCSASTRPTTRCFPTRLGAGVE